MKRYKTIEKLIRFYCKVVPLQKGKSRLIKTYAKCSQLKGEVVERTSFGALMQLDLSQYIQQQIFFRGAYEKAVLDLIQKLNQKFKFDLFMDVGANVGQHSLFAVVRASIPKAVAFEASPKIFFRLKKNIELNNLAEKISPYNLAILDRHGSVSINMPNISNNGTGYVHDCKEDEVSIKAIPLNDFVDRVRPYKKILIKIDVEGAEFRVLKGAHKLFSANKVEAVIVEIIKENLMRFGNDCAQLFNLLTVDYGLNGYLISVSGRLIRVTNYDALPTASEVLFLKSDFLK